MNLNELNPFVRFSAVQKYTNSPMFRDGAELYAYDCRLFYCLEGNGDIIVEDVPYHMSEGCMLIFKYGIPYRYSHSEKKDMVCISINFDFTFEYAISNSMCILPDISSRFNAEKALRTQEILDLAYIKNAKELEKNAVQIKKLFQRSGKYKHYELSALMKLLLVRAIEIYESEYDAEHTVGIELVEKVCSFIDENCEQISSGNDVAANFSYHSYYINRLMVKHKNCSLHKYINNARIQKAIEYLTTTDLTVAQVAEKCGFFDSAHFSKVFKSVTGYRPSKYRYL